MDEKEVEKEGAVKGDVKKAASSSRPRCSVCRARLGKLGGGTSVVHALLARTVNECPYCKELVCAKCKLEGRHDDCAVKAAAPAAKSSLGKVVSSDRGGDDACCH
jgi:hypothetical protein